MDHLWIYDTAVIGAGAAGLMAAIAAARAGAAAVLIEHMDMAAKKLPATGNGRCNYTNADQDLNNYYCDEPGFVQPVLTQFSFADTIRFFEQLGIRPVQKNGTCIYPESGQASSVRNALLWEAERLQIPILFNTGIQKIEKQTVHKQQVFQIRTKKESICSRTCILATGGKAAKKTGSDGSGCLYAAQLGHSLVPMQPALCALHADFKKSKLPAGVRIECAAALYVDGKQKAAEQGELQITDYGISGIVIFQFSRFAAKALAEGRSVHVVLDFQPKMKPDALSSYLNSRFHSIYHAHKTAAECMNGFLPDKLSTAVLKRASIAPECACAELGQKQVQQLAQLLKACKIKITGTNSFDAAQVTAGGIPVSEIHACSMESRLVSGLFFAGEIIDVDAKCGGYNLQWAWSSGYAAGSSAAFWAGSSKTCQKEKKQEQAEKKKNRKSRKEGGGEL